MRNHVSPEKIYRDVAVCRANRVPSVYVSQTPISAHKSIGFRLVFVFEALHRWWWGGGVTAVDRVPEPRRTPFKTEISFDLFRENAPKKYVLTGKFTLNVPSLRKKKNYKITAIRTGQHRAEYSTLDRVAESVKR